MFKLESRTQKISDLYRQIEEVKTPEFQFPLTVAVDFSRFKRYFWITFTDATGDEHKTIKLKNSKFKNKSNKVFLETELKIIEETINRRTINKIRKDRYENSYWERRIHKTLNREP